MSDPRLSDLLTFLAVQRSGSLTSAARELRVTPSNVSKSIARLEAHCGARLLERGTRGVTLTDAGRRLVPHFSGVIDALRATRSGAAEGHRIDLTIAGPSYLVGYLLPVVARCGPALRVRGLELAPAYVRAYFTENVFSVAFAPSNVEAKPDGWSSDPIGRMRVGLLGAPALAKSLGAPPVRAERVRELSFVGPMSNASDRFVALSDDCPLPLAERKVAHEVQTIGTALELAAQMGDLVVFGPLVAARHLIRERRLAEIEVEGWDVSEELSVFCNADRVLARVRRAIVESTRRAMSALEEH